MALRRERGFVRECHGDLHARNIVRQNLRLIAFDCMEFEPAFRWIDVAEEIAFLATDLRRYGGAFHAQAFLNGYLARSGDYEACRPLDLYMAHRALVRAKVSALEVANSDDTREIEPARSRFNRYLESVRHALSAKHPQLILMSGLSGSGKTWLAKQLSPRLGAIHLRSDIERKRAAGLAEDAHSQSGLERGLYSRDTSRQVYERLAQDAGEVLGGGFTAIVDATFLRQADRASLLALAGRIGILPILIHCYAPPEILKDRIAKRWAEGADPSEADLSVLSWQQSHFDPIGEEERLTAVEIDTSRSNAVDEVLSRLLERRGHEMRHASDASQ
jgi:predicted kinase